MEALLQNAESLKLFCIQIKETRLQSQTGLGAKLYHLDKVPNLCIYFLWSNQWNGDTNTIYSIKRYEDVLKQMYSSYNKLKISISHYYSGSIKIDNLLVWKRIPKYSQIRKNVFVLILQWKLVYLVMMTKQIHFLSTLVMFLSRTALRNSLVAKEYGIEPSYIQHPHCSALYWTQWLYHVFTEWMNKWLTGWMNEENATRSCVLYALGTGSLTQDLINKWLSRDQNPDLPTRWYFP